MRVCKALGWARWVAMVLLTCFIATNPGHGTGVDAAPPGQTERDGISNTGIDPMPNDDGFSDGLSRVGQPELPAIPFEGRRYEQIMNGDALDLPQRTGYLAVFDAATGSRLALIKVYDVEFDPDMEADVQDVFFTRMELDEAARRIVIENERGKVFYVTIDDQQVSPGQ